MLSIILPVYNGEMYIENCISSIITNNNHIFEIIVVDDGSTDNTKKILGNYSKYSQIKVFSINHSGLSEARNFGLSMASGEYITFIDVDDEIKKIDYAKIEENDLLVFGFKIDFVDENYSIPVQGINKLYNNISDSINDLFDLNLFNFVWNKVYRKDIIKNIKFSDKYYQGEDLAFNIEVFKRIKTVKVVEDIIYTYRKRNLESMSNKYVKNYDLILNNKISLLKNILEENRLYNYIAKELEVFVINLFKGDCYNFFERSNLIEFNVLENSDIIKKSQNKDIYSIIFKLTCRINSPHFINIVYYILFQFKIKLAPIYLKIRKIFNLYMR